MRRMLVALFVAAGVSVAAGAAGAAGRASPGARVTLARPVSGGVALAGTGTLLYRFGLPIRYLPMKCPPGSPQTLECFDRTGIGTVPGLGAVDESYAYLLQNDPPGCPPDTLALLPTAGRLNVRGKGQIEFRLDGTTGCLTRGEIVQAIETLTITAGSGIYAGASGGGTLAHQSLGPPSWSGSDTWAGTLAVPHFDFDLNPPTINGARGKTVRAPRRAKRLRVNIGVTARDDVDGAVLVTCRPKSRGWFKVGRTRVRCSAIDTSGNEATATFVVTVKRRR